MRPALGSSKLATLRLFLGCCLRRRQRLSVEALRLLRIVEADARRGRLIPSQVRQALGDRPSEEAFLAQNVTQGQAAISTGIVISIVIAVLIILVIGRASRSSGVGIDGTLL